MVKQHSFDCSTIRFTSQRNWSFFFWKTSIRCRRPMQVKFFLQSFPGSILVTVPQAVEQNFWTHNFFYDCRSETEHWQILLFCKESGIFFAVIWLPGIFFTHTHTHTQGPRSRIHTHTHNSVIFFTQLLLLLPTERLSHFFLFLTSSQTNFKHPTWVRLPKSPPSHRPLPDQIQLWRRVCPHQKEPRREMLQGTHLRPLPGVRTWRSVQTRTRLESRTLIMRTQTFSSDSLTTSHERAHHRHQNQVPSWTQQPLSWWTGMWNS